MKEWTKDQDIAATIITIGTFMGMILVPVTLIGYLIAVVRRKKLNEIVPTWLIAANIVWMFVYLFYLIYVNGHHNPAA